MNKRVAIAFCFLLITLGGIFTFQYLKFNDGKLHIIFCDVGQGDGIFIRSSTGKNILVDSGPDDKIIGCVEDYTPFWDRTISFAILTHPHADHFTGFRSILGKYKVLNFAGENIDNNTSGYKNLKEVIKRRGLEIKDLYSGDLIKTSDGLKILVLGPTQDFLNEVSPRHLINQASEQATLDMLMSYKNFDVILTGDTQNHQLQNDIQLHNVSNIEILKVPHHGSKTGLNEDILNQLSPRFAVISVGKKNRYAHPAPITLDLLKKFAVTALRTDQKGNIEFVSDGDSFSGIN